MDLRQLEHFVRVVELGSFTRAAMVLEIAQPALSRQIRALEVELHQNLLHRNGRGVTPTEAGEVLLRHARGVLHQLQLAREEIVLVGGRLAGRVSLGLPPGIARVAMLPLTRAFRERLPNAGLSVSEGFTVAMQDLVVSGRLDMAVLYYYALVPELEITPIRDEELFLIGSASAGDHESPVDLRAVAELPLVIPSRPSAIRMLVESGMARLGAKPRIALEVDGMAAILNLVRDGAGYAMMPLSTVYISGQRADFTVRAVTPQLTFHLVLATPTSRASTFTQRAVRELVLEVVPQVLGTLGCERPASAPAARHAHTP